LIGEDELMSDPNTEDDDEAMEESEEEEDLDENLA